MGEAGRRSYSEVYKAREKIYADRTTFRFSMSPRAKPKSYLLTIEPLVLLPILLLALLSGCAPLTEVRDAPASVAAAQPAPASIPYHGGQGQSTLAPLLRRVQPAVVNISVVSDGSVEQLPFYRDPEFRRFLDRFDLPAPKSLRSGRRQSVGSGLIVDAGRGYVLTNRHLVADARSITVTLKDRRSFSASLVGTDRDADIAVLEISSAPGGLQGLRFGNSDDLQVGDFVLAIGNPFGIGQTVTSGIISALGRDGLDLGDYIQTDASINPGNSGGPLVNLEGEVIGINTALLGPTGGNVGIGFAIPVKRVRPAMERILRGR